MPETEAASGETGEPDVTDPKAVPERNRHANTPVFDFKRFSEHGVLWLVNRVVFHPRGFALALVYSDDDGNVDPIGWRIEGDGSETWRFEGFDEDEKFRAIEGLLAQAAEFGGAPHTVTEIGSTKEADRG